MEQPRLFYPGRWAPLWALLAAGGIGGAVLGTAILVQEMGTVVDDSRAAASAVLRDASRHLSVATR